MMRNTPSIWAALAITFALVLASCGTSNDDQQTSTISDTSDTPAQLPMDTDGQPDEIDTGSQAPTVPAAPSQPEATDGDPSSEGLNLVIPTPTPTAPVAPTATTAPTAVPTVAPTPPPTATPIPTPTSKTCTYGVASGGNWTATYPADWYTHNGIMECRVFSPAPITLPTEVEWSMELGFYVDSRPWGLVMADVTTDIGDYWNSPTMTNTSVDGLDALIFEGIHGSGFPVAAEYRTYAVNLGNSVLFATARNYSDGSAAPLDYAASVTTLDIIMGSIAITPGTTPACSQTMWGTDLIVSKSVDLDANGTTDVVEARVNPATPDSAVITAFLSNGEVLQGTAYYFDQSPIHDLQFVDLDQDGNAEIIHTLDSNASGGNSALLTIAGCQLAEPLADPVHGAPGLVSHGSAGSPTNWGCLARANGTVGIVNAWGSSESPASTFTASYSEWDLVNGAWIQLASATLTGHDQPFHPDAPASVVCPWLP